MLLLTLIMLSWWKSSVSVECVAPNPFTDRYIHSGVELKVLRSNCVQSVEMFTVHASPPDSLKLQTFLSLVVVKVTLNQNSSTFLQQREVHTHTHLNTHTLRIEHKHILQIHNRYHGPVVLIFTQSKRVFNSEPKFISDSENQLNLPLLSVNVK